MVDEDRSAGTKSTVEVSSGPAVRRRFGRALVRVLDGPDAGTEIALSGARITGGRSVVNELVLAQPSVSGNHFELVLAETGVMLRDLGSTNGTWIGDVRIAEAWLAPGAQFRAGRCALQLVTADEIEVPISALGRFEDLVGESDAMRETFALLERVADTEIDVLIGGETGTGKELAARGLHARSSRRDAPFVVLDCASLPRELAEATILGHRKGAFTGAVMDRAGAFEDADRGTLFIDEVGELPLELQPKLLRVLDRREVQRIGETRPRGVDVRVVAATHRDLRRMVADGTFREDLYFRLAEISIELPPLRARGNDVVRLAEAFLEQNAGPRRGSLRWSDDAIAALLDHGWSGNVRELRKVVKRAALLAPGPMIHREDLMLAGRHRVDADVDELFSLPFKDAREAFERAYFTRLLEQTAGNVSEAARRAAYTRQGVHDLLRRLGLRADE